MYSDLKGFFCVSQTRGRRLVTREEVLFTIVSAEHPGSALLSGGHTRASWIHGWVYPVFRDAEESVTFDMIRGKNMA